MDNYISCWGDNDDGQLGIGTQTDSKLPVTVLIPNGRLALSVEAGKSNLCLLDNHQGCAGEAMELTSR